MYWLRSIYKINGDSSYEFQRLTRRKVARNTVPYTIEEIAKEIS